MVAHLHYNPEINELKFIYTSQSPGTFQYVGLKTNFVDFISLLKDKRRIGHRSVNLNQLTFRYKF